MRNYLIMVEGPHDVAAVSRCIKLCGITREYKKQKEVPQLWQRLIPTRYPLNIPAFVSVLSGQKETAESLIDW